ncbi:MAG: hypothetical protein ACPLXM_06140 [Bacteroidales bacterium]
MEKKLAAVISFLLHPVFAPLISLFILLYSGTYLSLITPSWKQRIILIVALGTVFIPFSLLPLLYFRKLTEQVRFGKHRDRFLPLFFSTISYYFTYHVLQRLAVPNILQILFLSATITVFVSMLITIFYRISLHTIAWGGLIGIFLALCFRFGMVFTPWLTGIIFLAGLSGYARLTMQAHKTGEIYAGYLTGFIVNFVLMFFLQ